MYIKAMGLVFGLICGSAVAQESDWFQVFKSDDGYTFHVKTASWKLQKNKGGAQISSAVGRIIDNRNRATFHTWYVSLDDCKKQSGELTTLKMNGAFSGDTDFVFNGGTAASEIAWFLCFMADRKQDDKSL